MQNELNTAIRAAIEAGSEITKIYTDPNADFEIEQKADNSPLTIADKKSNEIILSFLSQTPYPVLSEEGKSIDAIAAWLEENKLHVVHNFTVDDLFHLYRGGRVSKTAAVVGSMINLKPILHVDNEGHLIPLSKVRGRKKSLIALVDSMEKQIGAWRDKNDIVFISHGDSLEDAQFVAELIKKRLGIENFLINHIGPTIGAHSGPGTIALFYMGDYR